MLRIAINGFGRIGRAAFKVAHEKKGIDIVAINDLTDASTLAHLLRYDSLYGRYEHDVTARDGALAVEKKKTLVLSEKEPASLPWKNLRIDIVLECTGLFTSAEKAEPHLNAGAKRVILSAPAKGSGVPTYICGVNARAYHGEKIISNASCTTNAIAPVMAVLEKSFGVQKALMSTVHAYTADQRLHDAPHKDLRRARAAAENIVLTTTGAAIATTEVLPTLEGMFDGLSIRVPVSVVSLSDITAVVKRKTTKDAVNDALQTAAKQTQWKGILGCTDEPLVSADFIKDPRSSIVDLPLTNVIGGDLVKVIAWYDNEWGYANRLVELAELVGNSLGRK
jgi:glyceraldehyde 3-phosphate dehydrogenase